MSYIVWKLVEIVARAAQAGTVGVAHDEDRRAWVVSKESDGHKCVVLSQAAMQQVMDAILEGSWTGEEGYFVIFDFRFVIIFRRDHIAK